MKKTYISPLLDAIKLEGDIVMNIGSSLDKNPGGSDDVTIDDKEILSGKYQGGLLWEDDNNEAK